MLIFTKIPDLQRFLSQIRSQGKTIGFVPTMGALHQGHISLINASRQNCDITLCSVFVNPTQFNNQDDLKKYPRMPETDAGLLREAKCDVLFMPEVQEMYPAGAKTEFRFGMLDQVLEGAHRPGHFNGVAQVVKRFLEIVQPDKAFFGSKDYQQVMIVRELVKQMGSDVEIVACPVLREPDGLAMSSRNMLLSETERKVASEIPRMMSAAAVITKAEGIPSARKYIMNEVAKQPLMKIDYYEICDPENLALSPGTFQSPLISLIAVFVGKVRLIDNLMIT